MSDRGALILGFALLVTTGCGSSDGDGTPPTPSPPNPTLTNVYRDAVNSSNCAGVQCHTAPAVLSGFALGTTKDDLYTVLVNQPAAGPKCGQGVDGGPSPFTRVVPGDPDHSLLFLKLNGTPPCGDAMPTIGNQLSKENIKLVHDWIAAGAKND